jgi:hypothetical protein
MPTSEFLFSFAAFVVDSLILHLPWFGEARQGAGGERLHIFVGIASSARDSMFHRPIRDFYEHPPR